MHLSLQQKEQFFHEMSELLRSGRSVPDALEVVARSRSSAMRETAIAMKASTGDGSAVSYFAGTPSVFGALDREIVGGGESSGRLDDAMAYLRDYYAALGRARKRLIIGVLYPFFLLHFAAVALAVPAFMSDGPEAFFGQALGFLAIFYVLFGLAVALVRLAVKAGAANASVDQFLQSIPGIGGTRVALVGSRFCMLMGMLVRASGGILSAMRRSADASGSALFRHGAEAAVVAVQGGGALGASVAGTRAFPEAIDRAFQIGETSGRLDEEMTRQATRFTEQLDRRLDLIAGALGKGILLLVMLVVAWRIVSYYLGYFQTVNSLLQ